MSYPSKWGSLHLRLANLIRDEVATPATDGKDLTYANRNSYLNEAFEIYLSLFNASYRNDTEFLIAALSSMTATSSVSVSGGSTASMPDDFDVFLKLSKSGISISKEALESFRDIEAGRIPHKTPSDTSWYCLSKSSSIEILPTSASGTCKLSYIIKPSEITYTDGATDIPLSTIHFRSIRCFAAELIYTDKLDFDLAEKFHKLALELAPYKLITNG